MTGKLSKNFHGVGIGPFSKILAVKILQSLIGAVKMAIGTNNCDVETYRNQLEKNVFLNLYLYFQVRKAKQCACGSISKIPLSTTPLASH